MAGRKVCLSQMIFRVSGPPFYEISIIASFKPLQAAAHVCTRVLDYHILVSVGLSELHLRNQQINNTNRELVRLSHAMLLRPENQC